MTNSAFNTKHPPSKHAMGVLRRLRFEAEPYQEMNFTVGDKLRAFGYISVERRPSPYTTHKPGTLVDFAVITQAGKDALNQS